MAKSSVDQIRDAGEVNMTISAAILLLVASHVVARAEPRWVEGTYRNPALGYAIEVPRRLKGLTGDQDGPERGLRISLPSGGEILVSGEPNSLEWKTPAEGMQFAHANASCASGQSEILPAYVDRLNGSKGSLVCGDRVEKFYLAFRTGGGPIYWLRLETTRTHELDDTAILDKVAATFRPIRWK
jgi:hypothetical protein